jgi:hypothetical protein
VTVSPTDLAQLARIIEGVYEGKPAPRVAGRFGQYLRRCSRGRFEVQHLLAREGLSTTKGGWVSGGQLGGVTLVPLAPLEGSVPNDIWGPVEHLPALAEALGSLIDLTLWTSASAANRAHVLLSSLMTPIALSGTYRWFAPSRLTPGEATVDAIDSQTDWQSARFLKATADDASRAPHALEYILDYRLGSPGLKVFRSLAVRAQDGAYLVLPGIDAPARPLTVARPVDARLMSLDDGELAIVFAYVEPWSSEWIVIDVRRTDAAGCLAHLVTWADFQAELRDRPGLGPSDLSALRTNLVRAGIDPPPAHEVMARVPPRELARPARALVRWLRYRV